MTHLVQFCIQAIEIFLSNSIFKFARPFWNKTFAVATEKSENQQVTLKASLTHNYIYACLFYGSGERNPLQSTASMLFDNFSIDIN